MNLDQTNQNQPINSTANGEVDNIFKLAVQMKASDIHFYAGKPVIFRINGNLVPQQTKKFTSEDIMNLLSKYMDNWQKDHLLKEKEADFSFRFDGQRMRANIYYEMNQISASLRVINPEIKTFAELNLPPILEKFALAKQGFFLVVGPTGHGKSTSIAAMIEYINQNRAENIITIEDPVEYEFVDKKSYITQREVYSDTLSFSKALKSALREDPNVIFLGEIRDKESAEAALTLAETGHLVLSTLHTNNASQTIDRLVDIFPEFQQRQIRQQVAGTLLGIISQRLLPRVKGGRIVACEVLIANTAVKASIREGKSHQIPNIIQTSFAEGMINLDKSLADLVKRGEVKIEDALVWAENPQNFKQELY
ncbi:MAG: PilT/PilU family type 4a pilus ATPase [Patescibacteria group bacterium]|nr:PilT/PilU family type 4a pilus ATPase [Patescibacteria group bacterium]